MAKAKEQSAIVQVSPSEAAIALETMIRVNLDNANRRASRRSLFMWGPPGIAKSSIVRQVAAKINYKVIDIRLTQMEPTDLRGIPVPVDGLNGTMEVKWAIPTLLPKMAEGTVNAHITDMIEGEDGKLVEHVYDGAIILLDELPNAAPSVQAGSYQLVLDGELGEYKVPKNAIVIAAGNRETDKGGTYKMPSPLQNRFTHIEMRSDFEDWQRHAILKGFHPSVVGYVTAFKNDLFDFDPRSSSRGFATPRSWEAVSDIMRQSASVPGPVLTALVCGTVGDGTGVKFLNYREMADKMPRAEDILSGKIKSLTDRKNVSVNYALSTALAYELKAHYDESQKKGGKIKEADFYKSADNFMTFVMDNFQPEITVMAIRSILTIYNIHLNPQKMTTWARFTKDFAKLVFGS